jgi:transcriptional regulator with XRE-family HTH domain
MANKATNRIKVILVEKDKSSKWLAEKLGKDESTISRWCTNKTQPPIDTLSAIAKLLNVDIRELLSSTK